MGESGDNYVLKSKIILDAEPYDYEYFGKVEKTDYTLTWEKSTIRKWLNETFYNTAFTTDDKEAIVKSTVDNTTTVKKTDGTTFFEIELYEASADTEDFIYTPSLKEWIDWYGVILDQDKTIPQKTCHITNVSDYSIALGARVVDKLGNTSLGTGWYKGEEVQSKSFNYDKSRKYGAVSLRSGDIAVAENGNFSNCGDNDGGALDYLNIPTSTGVCPMMAVKKSSVTLRDAS